MCKFFSCVSTGNGKPIYFDWELRKKVLSGELKNYESDSHTSIADYFGYKAEKEDVLNKYEYNPLTKVFTIDQQNAKEKDHIEIHEWLEKVDWKTIVEPLIIKPIINPFVDRNVTEITPEDLGLLKKWASVGASVRDSVRDSVGASVGDSVRASVGDSVWASVWDLVGAYISNFFDIKYKYDFNSGIKLWESGLVPSYDGKVWRLHAGEKAGIIFEQKHKEVK